MNWEGRRLGAAQSSRPGSVGSNAPSAVSGTPLKHLSRNQLRFHQRAARDDERSLSWPIILLVLAGTVYNGALALLNANGLRIELPAVIASEFIILGSAALMIFRTGLRPSDALPAALLAFFLINAVFVSLVNNGVYVEMARNGAIIALFLMLGTRMNLRSLHRAFMIAGAVVAVILVIEFSSVPLYADLFAPAAYFEQTRGIPPAEFDEQGLFGNALGFDGRFFILKISNHRTSSLFLEQVSLANFAAVLAIFLASMWKGVSLGQRGFLITLIVFILITNNSRTALGIVLAAPMVYWLAPKLNRYTAVLVMPGVLIASYIVTLIMPPTNADVLEGRLGLTMRTLADLDLAAIAGLKAENTPLFADSGFTYVIYASTILGMLSLWLFVSLVTAGWSANQKRVSLLLSWYLFSNLTVSGTSIFSIKTAALLWLLVGVVRRESEEAPEAARRPEQVIADPPPPRFRRRVA